DVVPELRRYQGILWVAPWHGSLRWVARGPRSRAGAASDAIGRVGTAGRVHWARSVGATSIDSALPLRAGEHLEAFLAALGPLARLRQCEVAPTAARWPRRCAART